MLGRISVLLFFSLLFFPAVVFAQNATSCTDLSNCLNDLSAYVTKCGKELKDFWNSIPKNSLNESCTKAGDAFLRFVDLQGQRAKQIGDCISKTDTTDPTKCPKMVETKNRRFKRDSAEASMWLKAALKVQNQCSNGKEIINDVSTRLKISQYLTRQQVLETVKQMCKGTTNLTIDDMPVIGGDIRLENSINKVLKECKNGQDIVKQAKDKVTKKEFITRTEIVDFVKKQCQGTSTLDVNDLPNYYDARLESAITKVQKDCSNSKIILSEVSEKYKNKTLFSRQQVVDYVSKRCDGKSTLKSNDLPAFYGEDSTPFGKKLESAILKVQKECKNSDNILYEIKKQQDKGQMKDGDEIVNYVKSKCDGKSTLVVDDLPFRDCSQEKVTKSTQACLKMLNSCNKSKYCNDCYELSPLHDAITRSSMDLSESVKIAERDNCPPANNKTRTISS